MKKDIHPEYHNDCKVTCVCGNSFTTGSTLSEIQVEICSKCHPFFTGKQKLIDTAGRVDKFRERMAEARKHEEESARRAAERKTARKKAGEAAAAAQFSSTNKSIDLKDLAKETEQQKPAVAKAKRTAKTTAKKTPATKAVPKKSVTKKVIKKPAVKSATKKPVAKKPGKPTKKKGGAKK